MSPVITVPFTRSLIERSIGLAREAFARHGIRLPRFADWTAADWQQRGAEAEEIRACMLGWDVTDFGSGDFPRIGRTLFTVRNGSARDPRWPKNYAEKLILDPEGQRAPLHFHRTKREDIINRGGGNVLVRLCRADEHGKASASPFVVQVDGLSRMIEPNTVIRLEPGQSVCIEPRTLHQFWGEEGTGTTVTGEVSSVCDDWQDNVFYGDLCRFPAITEDVPRVHALCHEYPAATQAAGAAR